MKRNHSLPIVLIISIMTTTIVAEADPGSASGDDRGFESTFQSDILGETVPVSIYLPSGYYESDKRYPVLYILESGLYDRAMTGIIDARSRLGTIPEIIVVGVGTSDRWRDFTPTRAGIPGRDIIPSSGGAGQHRKFLSEELIPRVKDEFRTQPFRMLFGHSIAGLHAITTMFEEPGLFGACIVTSPSLWWDGEIAVSIAKKTLESNGDLTGSMFLAIGNEDETMQGPLRRFENILAEVGSENFRWGHKIFPDSDHQEVPLAAFNVGLSFIFAGWALPDSAFEAGIGAVDSHYKKLSIRLGYEIEVPEGVMNRLGYRALNAGDIEAAVSIFKRNVRTYPQSANTYDSLGEALLKRGDIGEALAQYLRALELDPDNPRIRSTVERLGREKRIGLQK